MALSMGLLGASLPGLDEDFVHLTTQVLSSSSSSFAFDNLTTYAAGYKHLQLVVVGKALGSSSSDRLRVRVNGGTSSYPMHGIGTTGSSVVSGYGAAGAQDSNVITDRFSMYTGIHTAVVIDILDPFSTTKTKVLRCLSGHEQPGSGEPNIQLKDILFTSTSQISNIAFSLGNTNWAQNSFEAGSRFSLFGLKAA